MVGGLPVYPVKSGSVEGTTARARLSGGFTLTSPKGRRVRVVLTRFVRNGAAARVDGRVVSLADAEKQLAHLKAPALANVANICLYLDDYAKGMRSDQLTDWVRQHTANAPV